MENVSIWVVVSDKTKTRIFEKKDPPQHWAKVELFERATPRHEHSTHDSQSAHHGRHTNSHTDLEERKYCPYFSEVSNYLRHARESQKYHELYLVAGPDALGELKDHLDKETTKKVKKAINKDLAHFTQPEIEKYLADEFVFYGKVN